MLESEKDTWGFHLVLPCVGLGHLMKPLSRPT
jgi:hypothetical protein